MRVSERMRYDTVNNRVAKARADNARQLDRLSSQKDILKLSDDPIGATQAIRFRDKISTLEQFSQNIEFSKGYLERTETALQAMSDNLIRAKELAVAMGNDTYDANSRDATAREVREIISEVVNLGNSTFNGRYVFGGFRNQTPPISANGEFLGDDGKVFLEVSPGQFRQVNVNARQLFEPPPEEIAKGRYGMVQVLDNFYEALINNDKDGIHSVMGELDYHLEQSTSYQATVGSTWKALNDTGSRVDIDAEQTKVRLSETEDADVFDATSEFKRTENVLQSTLLGSTKLLQPSLLNFLQ